VVEKYQVVDLFITNITGEVMKNSLLKILLITSLFGSSVAIAGSNNGYTTAANVYTGSSSRTWYGGGVAFVLSEWKKERSVPNVAPAVEEQPSTNTESTSN
jgi:hypothetical protein